MAVLRAVVEYALALVVVAVEFYRQCGWRDARELRLVGTRIQTTILNKRVGNDPDLI
jgi:hypothetical protein